MRKYSRMQDPDYICCTYQYHLYTMSSQLGYDLCTYNKIDLFKTGVFSTMSYTFSVNVLLNALEWEGIQHSSINIRKVVSFFHNFTGVHCKS